METMNYYKYFSALCFVFIFLSVYGQENKAGKLSDFINEGRYFESKELYNEIYPTLDFNEDLYYKCRMHSFMNRKDSAAHCLEELLEYYPEFLDNKALNIYVELFNLYFQLHDYEKGMSTYKRIVEHLEDNPYNIDEKEIEQCRKYVEERLAYFKEEMNGPRIRLKRKATDESLNILGEDKLRCEVSFNGVKHKTIFDTGSEYYCTINRYYAEKRGIKYDTCKVVKELINNTEFPVCRVTLDSVEMGNIIFYNLPVRLFDNDVIKYVPDSIKEDSIKVAKIDSVKNEVGIPIIGLPTMQLIGKFLIDYEKNTLSFPNTLDTLAMAREPSMFFCGNKISTQIKLNNVDFVALLDTGCDGAVEIDSIFYEKWENDIPIDTVIDKEQYNYLMLHGAWINIPYEIPEKPIITFNGKPILPFGESDAPLRIYSMHSIWPNLLFDGVIGYDLFKRIGKKVLLDLDNMRLEAIE